MQNHALFYEQISNLTSYQLHFLMALLAGKANELNKKDVINQFNLGSTANIAVIKKALLKKELIDIVGKTLTFADPIMPHWLKINLKL